MVKPNSTSENLGQQQQAEREDSCKYKGVRKRKWGKWVSEIRLPNSRERIWLGSYDTPEKAARAFDAASFCLRGLNTKFNFPATPPEIPDAESLTASEIQAVAARFANEEVEEASPSNTVAVGANSDGGQEILMDWSFLNMLDSSSESLSDFSYFNGFDENVHNEHNFHIPIIENQDDKDQTVIDNNFDHDREDYNNHFFNDHSFLWNF